MISFQVKRLIIRHRDEDHKLQIFERFAAGSTAGVISQTIVYPLEVCIFDYFCFFFYHNLLSSHIL